MQKCREKGLALDKRLEAVKANIDAWDRREEQWQARVSRRLRILWGFMGVLALVFAAVRLFEQIRPVPAVLDASDPGYDSSTPRDVGYPSQNLSFLSPDFHSCVAENVQDKEQKIRPSRGLALDERKESSCPVDAEPATTETSPAFHQESDDALQRVIGEL